jgi:small basic protein
MEPENPFADRPPPEPVVPPWRVAQPEPQVFGVPRRYDLATLMAVTLAYACLFGALRALSWPPEAMVWTAGFLTVIGAAQALLFGGKRPREASLFAGVGLLMAVVMVERGIHAVWQDVLMDATQTLSLFFIAIVLPGFLLGYAGGVIVAGVFLVAHHLRSGLRRFRGSRRAALDESRPEP